MRKIIKYPDPILRRTMAQIKYFQPELSQIAAEMIDTMRGAQGIGIAANQVDLDMHMAIITDNGRDKSEMTIINPEIIDSYGEDFMIEGCLSLPHIQGTIRRKEWVKIRYFDLDGKQQELEANGMLAKCIQHEIDHLNGMTIYNKMNMVDKAANKKVIEYLKALYDQRRG